MAETQQDDAAKTVLVLRSCKSDMSSYGGFVWPKSGPVEAPDWDQAPKCGSGLHGLLWGEGDQSLLCWEADANWLVVRVVRSEIVDLGGKVKYPRGVVVHCGPSLSEAAAIIIRGGGDPAKVIGGTATAGYGGTAAVGTGGTATAGTGGTATAGNRGTATAGDRGTATAGDDGTATAGNRGTATAGTDGTATAGNRGTATAGTGGTATAGNRGTATAGDCGTATAGYGGTATVGTDGTATAGTGGTATAGNRGTATVGDCGTATAKPQARRVLAIAGCDGKAACDEHGIIAIKWLDTAADRYRLAVGYAGENGIEPGVFYRVRGGKLVKCPE